MNAEIFWLGACVLACAAYAIVVLRLTKRQEEPAPAHKGWKYENCPACQEAREDEST